MACVISRMEFLLRGRPPTHMTQHVEVFIHSYYTNPMLVLMPFFILSFPTLSHYGIHYLWIRLQLLPYLFLNIVFSVSPFSSNYSIACM